VERLRKCDTVCATKYEETVTVELEILRLVPLNFDRLTLKKWTWV